MIDLSNHEATAVFSAFLSKFRVNERSQYRGPAAHRKGDNPTALWVDISHGGRFYDHVIGEGGDTVKFVMTVHRCSFIQACRWISALIGRNVLGDKPAPARPRITTADMADAGLFRVGFCWQVERYLDLLKELFWIEGAEIEPGRIRDATRLLSRARAWSDQDAARFLRKWGRKNPVMVASCVAEAKEAQMGLAHALSPPADRSAIAA